MEPPTLGEVGPSGSVYYRFRTNTKRGSWETFRIIRNYDWYFAFRTSHGDYMAVSGTSVVAVKSIGDGATSFSI